jgi:hypothetical protein
LDSCALPVFLSLCINKESESGTKTKYLTEMDTAFVSEQLKKIWLTIPSSHDNNLSAGLGAMGISLASMGITLVNSWLIGPYWKVCDLRRLVNRDPEKLVPVMSMVSRKELRFGNRDYDVWTPNKALRTRFRSEIENKLPKIINKDDPYSKLHENLDVYVPRRRTEQYQEIKGFYVHKTLEAHHIVEDSILQKIMKNKSPGKKLSTKDSNLIRSRAPTVLVAAELHQQHFTDKMKDFRNKEDFFQAELISQYDTLYSFPNMGDLKDIATKIINSLELK